MTNPLNKQMLIDASVYRPIGDWRLDGHFYDALGVDWNVITELEACCTRWRAVGDFDLCDCDVQGVPEKCGHTTLCAYCADKARKRLAADLIEHMESLYQSVGQPLRVDAFEFTIPASYMPVVEACPNEFREAAVETIYRWYGYSPKRVVLAIVANLDVWHSDRLWMGAFYHVHATVFSWVKDRRSGIHSFADQIGNKVSLKHLTELRPLWGRVLKERFGVSVGVEPVVHFARINENEVGHKAAVAKLAGRLNYMYRNPILDVNKFVHHCFGLGDGKGGFGRYAVMQKRKFGYTETRIERVDDMNLPWIGRLLNFYADGKKGESKKTRHVQLFGLLASGSQKRVANELLIQHDRAPAAMSPTERKKQHSGFRCFYHPHSKGRVVARGMTLDEFRVRFPKSKVRGRVKDRIMTVEEMVSEDKRDEKKRRSRSGVTWQKRAIRRMLM